MNDSDADAQCAPPPNDPGKRKHYTEPICPGVDPEDAEGLVCPDCGCRHFRVVSTRRALRGRILRRRECRHCGKRLTTMEKPTDATEPQ